MGVFLIGLTTLSAKAAPDPNAAIVEKLPDSCLPDFSDTLEAPAGQRGFLTVGGDGHFRWKDGQRARFWGINVSSTRLNIPHEQIEQVVRKFARAGLNLVRLEAIDNRNCLLGSTDAPDSRQFDAQYLDRIDYWMDALRRHGIYYYLDLLDFRTFKTGDGVLNAEKLDRGARPYAVFDRYLIELQKEYATHLLTHRNPYSGLRPVDDPALALVEICNEHGFFLYPEKLESLAEPYRSDLRARWSRWLLARYRTRERLAAAWGKVGSFPALRADEDPDKQSVDLPLLAGASGPMDASVADTRRAPKRLRDGVEFLAGLQRAYFREMRGYLRGLGLKVPVTAVVSSDVIPDVASVAQECDFTSENWYGESISGDPRQPGIRFYANRNPLRDDSADGFAPYTAALRWNNKPVVIREWATNWPNRWRAGSVPEALAYAALQDFDAMLLFGYQTNRALNGAEAEALNDYAFQNDPPVWGLVALAGQAFLKQAIRPAARTVTLAYTTERLFAWPNQIGDLHRAAWSVRLNSVTPGAARRGHSADRRTPTGTARDLQTLRGLLKSTNTKKRQKRNDSARSFVETGVWRSDTGQITRWTREGRLEVRTPTLRMLAGEFTPGRVYDLGGGCRFSTPTPVGALLVFALDGRALEHSRHLVVKMVSRAENTGQVLAKAPPGSPNVWALRAPGKAPIRTFGRASAQPTRLWLPTVEKGKLVAKPALALWMQDGTWEVEVRDGRAAFACDTPDIQTKLSAEERGWRWEQASVSPASSGLALPEAKTTGRQR
ncbi:MAG TPA: hypothetical protein VFB21_02350 [Chthonomonadaceae bacterium]|nr:hypothetical protein [Chthonomonadaceae bacterium]